MHVMPTYEKYIAPFKNEADLIVPNNSSFDMALDVIRTYLRAKSSR
jgi:uridine kinase